MMPEADRLTVGVVGGGTVGRATARVWLEWADVRVHDLDPAKGTHCLGDVLDCNLIFVCLPESAVEDFFKNKIAPKSNQHLVLKSTVPIGTTRKLYERYRLYNLVHSPEFVTARCSLVDAQLPSRNIIGGVRASGCSDTETLLTGLYLKRFPGVPVYVMTSDESEAIKLFVNGFFAVKVAYFNECYQAAKALCLSWPTILQGILADGRIAHSHTQVPGPDGQFGFGGACLPKDLEQLIQGIEEAGAKALVTRAAKDRNALDRNALASHTVG